jgi:hypothetical protein
MSNRAAAQSLPPVIAAMGRGLGLDPHLVEIKISVTSQKTRQERAPSRIMMGKSWASPRLTGLSKGNSRESDFFGKDHIRSGLDLV